MIAMSSSSLSPRLFRGAIVSLGASNLLDKAIVFQYNPDGITRTVTPKYSKTPEGTETFRFGGTPTEDISLTVEFDAIDHNYQHFEMSRLKFVEDVLQSVTPQLAALEALLYPSSAQVIENALLAERGELEIVPPIAPITLFIFGETKVLPVKITSCTITEQIHDANLNPIHAKVDIKMSVLTYTDLKYSKMAYALYQANHVAKEVMSLFALANSI